jgi:hypothetical protein
MAVVKGVKEKVHLPLYDSIKVDAKQRLGQAQATNILRFFTDVAGKSKLQTNMQAASLLPHWNTYEARALRVIISDLVPQMPDTPGVQLRDVVVSDHEGQPNTTKKVSLAHLTPAHFVEFSRRLEDSSQRALLLSTEELKQLGIGFINGDPPTPTLEGDEFATFDRGTLDRLSDELIKQGGQDTLPPPEQITPNNGSGSFISRFIYNTVTTFFVGEKIMIQVPTFFFPAGAGPFSEDGQVTTHGEPTPEATFRFAEPIFIDSQQNFRVEIEIPDSEVLGVLKTVVGPLFIWVVIDGYMTRDVQ